MSDVLLRVLHELKRQHEERIALEKRHAEERRQFLEQLSGEERAEAARIIGLH